MNTEDIKTWKTRFAIAEFCGYKWWSSSVGCWMSAGEDVHTYWADGLVEGKSAGKDILYGDMRIPFYTIDLNHIHEAEKHLSDKSPGKDQYGDQIPSQRAKYRLNLCVETAMNGGPITATAQQRCNAFLKTIGVSI